MDEEFIRQLNLRIDEHHQYLRERLDDLQEAIRAIHAALTERLDSHDVYHAANEHRWGMIRLAQRHPFRLALAASLAAWALAAALPDSVVWCEDLLRRLAAALSGRWSP